MEIKTTNQAVSQSLVPLHRIYSLLSEANLIWKKLDCLVQEKLIDFHGEDTNLAHCLRWGEQATSDFVEMASIKTSAVTAEDVALHAMSLWDGVVAPSNVIEAWGQGILELRATLAPFAELDALLCDALFNTLGKNFPGAYGYDVTEGLGMEIGRYILANNGYFPREDWIHSAHASLVLDFMPDDQRAEVIAILKHYLPLAAIQ